MALETYVKGGSAQAGFEQPECASTLQQGAFIAAPGAVGAGGVLLPPIPTSPYFNLLTPTATY